MKAKLIAAMEAAGYYFDKLESTDDQLRFLGDYGTVMYMGSWDDTKQWLEGVVFDNPDISDRVEKILHPERFKNTRQSVLKQLQKKKRMVDVGKKKAVMQSKEKKTVRHKDLMNC